MQINTAFKYEKTNADNLGLLPPPTTAKTDAQPTQKRKKISNDKARDSHYKRVLKKADTHEKCQTFLTRGLQSIPTPPRNEVRM